MSNVVDRRVVEMSFDNSNFEKNVSKSISSLDKLKQSLKMDGVAKGLTDVDKAANGINLQRIADAASALQQRFSVLGEIGHNAIMKITGAVGNLASRMTSFVKEGIVSGGIRRAMNLENAHFMMQGLLKDETAVSEIMKNVSASVEGTAYSLDAAAKVAAQFAATGMRAGDQMYGALRGVAGVAAMTNAEYQDIGLIFTQVAGQGRLMGDQLLQLSTRGINAAATLTNYMNKMGITANATEGDIRDMVSKGKISFELFAAAMDDAFGEHALKANETFSGAMSNIRSALARIGADFVAPLIVQNGELVNLFNRVREMVNAIRSITTPYATAAADWVKQMASGLSNVVVQITGVLSGTYQVNDTTRTFLNIIESIRNIMAGFQSIIAPIKMAWKDVFPEGLPNILLTLTERFRGLTEHAKLNAGQMSTLRSIFQIVFTVAKNLAIVIDGALTTAFGLLGKAINLLGPVFDKFTGFISKNVSAVIKWADQLGIVEKVVSTVTKFATSSGGAIKAWFNNFKNLPQVQVAITGIRDLFYRLRDAAQAAFGDVGKVFGDFIKKVAELRNIKFSDIIKLFNDLKEVIKSTFGPTITKWIDDFKEKFGSFADFMHDAFGKIGDAFIKGKEVIGSAIDWIVKKLTDIPLGSFVAVGFGGALLFLANKVVDIVSFIKNPLQSLNSMFSGVANVLNSFAKIETAFAGRINAQSMFTIAKAIAVLAGSMIALAFVPWDRLQQALIAMGALALGMSLLAGAFAVINKVGGGGIEGVGIQLLALAGTMYAVTEILKNLAEIPVDQLSNSVTAFTVILIELVGAMAILGQFKGKDRNWEQAAVLVGIGAAMKLIVSALLDLQDMDIGRAVAAIPLMIVMFKGLSSVMRVSGGVEWGAGLGLVGAAAAVWLMVGVVKSVNKMTMEEIARGTIVIAAFEALLILLAAAARLAGANAGKAAAAFTSFGTAVFIMTGAIKLISYISDADIERGIAVMAKMELLFAGVALVTRLAGENAGKAGVAMIAFSASMIIMSAAIGIISMIPEERVDAATNAIMKIGAIMALIVGMTKWAGEAKGTMIAIAAALAIISIALAGLTFVDQDALESVTEALSKVMLSLAVVVAATGIAQKATGTMILVTAALVAISGCILLLKDVNPQNAIGNAIAIGTLMVAMAASLALMETVKSVSGSAIAAMGALTLVVAGLAVVLWEIQALEIQASMTNVLALSTLLLAMAGVILIFDKGHLSAGAMTAATNGALALGAFVAILIGVIGAIGAVMSQDLLPMEEAFDKGLEILGKLGKGLGDFVGQFVAGIGEAIAGALPNIADSITLFAVKMNAAGAAFAVFPDSAVDKVTKIAALMLVLAGTELVGAITNGLSWLMGGFSMDKMVLNMQKFVRGCTTIAAMLKNTTFDDDKIESVRKLGEFFIAVQNALPKQGGLWQSIAGESMDMGEFGQTCFNFIKAMKDVNAQLKGVEFNDEAIEAAVKAGELFAALQNSLPRTGGALQDFLGEKLDLGLFGSRIKTFMTTLVDASDILESNPIDPQAIESAKNAGSMMSELQNSLPTENGKIQEWFGGTMTLDTFGSQIRTFFSYLTSASKLLVTNPISTDAVETAKNAGMMMSELANSLPPSDGEIAKWFGSDHLQLDEFGAKLQAFGSSLNIFHAHVQNIKSATISNVSSAVQTLSTMFTYLPDDESWFDGTMSIENFGQKLKNFGVSFKEACDALSGTNVESMNTMARSVTTLMMAFKDAKGFDASGLDSFGDLIKDLATAALTNFASVFENYDIVSVTSGFIQRFVDSFTVDPEALTAPFTTLIERALHTLSNGEAQFREAATKLMTSFGVGIQAGTIIAAAAGISLAQSIINLFLAHVNANGPAAGIALVDAIIQGISNQTGAAVIIINLLGTMLLMNLRRRGSEFQSTAEELITKFIAGIANSQQRAQTQVTLLVTAMITTFNLSMTKFVEVGVTLVDSVVKGIGSGDQKAINAANGIVKTIYSTLINGANSLYIAGGYLIQGMVNGINDNAWKARNAALNLANSITSAVNNAMKIHSPSEVGYEQGQYYDEGIANGLTDGTRTLKEVATEIANVFATELETAMNSTLEAMYKFGEKVMLNIQYGMEAAGNEALVNIITKSLGGVDSLADDISKKIREGIAATEGFGETLEENLTKFSPEFEDKLKRIGEFMIQTIQSGLEVGGDVISDMIQKQIDSIMPALLTKIGATGADILATHIINGMIESGSIVSNGVSKMLTSIESTVLMDFYEFGKRMTQNMIIGFESNGTEDWMKAFANIIDSVKPNLETAFNTLAEDMAKKLAESSNSFSSFSEMLLDSITESKEMIFAEMERYGMQIMYNISEGMKKMDQTVITLIEGSIKAGYETSYEIAFSYGQHIMNAMLEGMKDGDKSPAKIFDESIEEIVPNMLKTFQSMGTQMMEGMMTAPAEILKTAMLGIFPDLAENFLIYGEEFIKNLANGIFLRQDDPAHQIQVVVNAMINMVRNSRYLFIQSGSYIVDGIIKGIEQNAARAMAAASALAKQVNEAFNDALGIHSPSKVGEQSGGYYDDGIALGIIKRIGHVKESVLKLADGVQETLDTALTTVIDDLNDDIEFRPTITPILNIDDVRRNFATIDTMFEDMDAMELNGRINARNEQVSENQNGSTKEEITYEFTQNNYSPKALSRLEIYRNTKNLVTRGRKVVTTK